MKTEKIQMVVDVVLKYETPEGRAHVLRCAHELNIEMVGGGVTSGMYSVKSGEVKQLVKGFRKN